ncbi:hypothetical protein AZE42_13142 [Rhizopogon vesiculosus]|uniref:Flavodoxin-like domain-containing protein n=1 Tax=Rhizopogon vesiculosus TaxID=180088 RepID=A0A1J8QFY1_9AGAM|nr:hypothetical protein AZE42_13142 [Rhizopogon vesiculosus]
MELRSDLPDHLFEDMFFCVLGPGDTAYGKLGWPSKKLSRWMQSLGGCEICPRGEGDKQHCLERDDALYPWVEHLLEVLHHLYPSPSPYEQDTIPVGRPPTGVSVRDVASNSNPVPLDEDEKYHTSTALVECNSTRITAEDWFQDVRHLEFSFKEDVKITDTIPEMLP